MKEIDKRKISAMVHFNNLIIKELKDNGIKCWIAGGVLRDYFSNKPLNSDCDIFFSNINDYNKAKDYLKSKGAKTIWESKNGMKVKYCDDTFDLVKIFNKNPSDTINKFDFTVSMFATDGQKIYYGSTSFKDLEDKQLVIHIISNPLSTLKRVLKHYKKGFTMSADETKKLYAELNDLPYEENNYLLNATGTSGDNIEPTKDNSTPTKTEPTKSIIVNKNKKYLLISALLLGAYLVFKKK